MANFPTDDTAPKRKRIVIALVLSSYMIVGIDGSLVITAIEQIASDLELNHTSLSWVQNAYVLAFGGFMLMGGRLGDSYGRKPVFNTAIILFCIGSLGAGIARSAAFMISARLVQGTGSALMAPTALALIMDYFEGSERVKVIAWYSSISGLALCIGLVVGGAITSYASWRAGFLVNIPIVAIMLYGSTKWLLGKQTSATHFDIPGTLLSVVAVFSLIYAIDGAARPLLWFAIGGAGLVLFCIVERKTQQPIMPPALFRSASRCNGYLSRMLLVGALMGYNFFISEYMQRSLAFSPLLTGMSFLPMTVTTFFGALTVPRLVAQHGNITVLSAGLSLLAVGFSGLIFLPPCLPYAIAIFLPMIFIGFGQGLAMSPLTNLGIEGVDTCNSGAASGIVNMAHQVGGAFGLSAMVRITENITAPASRFRYGMAVALVFIIIAAISTSTLCRNRRHKG